MEGVEQLGDRIDDPVPQGLHYVSLGIAAAADRGLIVPNIKDAHRMSLLQLAEAITGLAETARAGKTAPAARSSTRARPPS